MKKAGIVQLVERLVSNRKVNDAWVSLFGGSSPPSRSKKDTKRPPKNAAEKHTEKLAIVLLCAIGGSFFLGVLAMCAPSFTHIDNNGTVNIDKNTVLDLEHFTIRSEVHEDAEKTGEGEDGPLRQEGDGAGQESGVSNEHMRGIPVRTEETETKE